MEFLAKLEKTASTLSHLLKWVAGAGLIGMLGLTVADIIGIKLFRSPVPGAIELVGFIGVVVIAFALAYTEVLHGNIQVEFFVMRMPRRWQASIGAFVSFLGLVLFALLAWQSYNFARVLQSTGEVSMTQNIAFYPFVYAIAFCCIPLCLVLLAKCLKSVMKAIKK